MSEPADIAVFDCRASVPFDDLMDGCGCHPLTILLYVRDAKADGEHPLVADALRAQHNDGDGSDEIAQRSAICRLTRWYCTAGCL